MTKSTRYTTVAIFLHWIIAVSIILMLASGLSFDNIEMAKSFKFNLYQWHKSLGLLVLIAVALRILWRLFHQPPALPVSFPKWEAIASKLGHLGLYVLMVAMPMSGWALVSSSSYGLPTIIFGAFEWPHLPNMAGNGEIHEIAESAHAVMAWLLLGLVFVHIAAVAKHIIIDKVNLLPRMGVGKEQ